MGNTIKFNIVNIAIVILVNCALAIGGLAGSLQLDGLLNKDVDVVCAYRWHSDIGEIFVVVSYDSKGSIERRIDFYCNEGGALYSSKMYGGLYYMEPLDVGSNLMTVWTTGSSFMVRIFSISHGKLSLCVKHGSDMPPEIIDLDNDGIQELILSNGKMVVDDDGYIIRYPESVNVYKRKGGIYIYDKTVGWKDRLKLGGAQ